MGVSYWQDRLNAIANQSSNTAYTSVPSGPIPKFLNKFSEWQFNCPSNTLWTIQILLHNSGDETSDHSLVTLYKNIITCNRKYKLQNNTDWDISNKNVNASFLNQFISTFNVDETQLFLADSVSFESNSVTVNSQISNTNLNYSGFIQFGKIATAKNQDLKAKIRFLCSNWDINDIFFDPWISAIAQQGLIESSELPSIKSDIFLSCYSSSVPGKSYPKDTWQLRKTYKFLKAVPVSREQTTLGYAPDDAFFKTINVDFSFQEYAITYSV